MGNVSSTPCDQPASSSVVETIPLTDASTDSNNSLAATQDVEKIKNLIRSRFKDVMVKAGQDIYYLDRIKLVLKSDYFEKLLVHNRSEENADPIEIPIDSDTFHSVVDVIYSGKGWDSVLTMDNCVSVLKAKDFLQINESDYVLSNSISKCLPSTPTASESQVFELFNFIVQNGNLQESLRKMYIHLAKNLERFQNHEEFLSLPVDHFIKIIMEMEEARAANANVREICVDWICHDLENRLPCLVKIANVLRRKQRLPCELDASVKVKLPDINEQNKVQVVGRYFRRLLSHVSSFVDPGVAFRPEDKMNKRKKEREQYTTNENNAKQNRLQEYLKNGTLYDITVKVGEKTYKLHRCILQSESKYFEELFSREYAEASVHCDDIPNMPDKDREYVIDGIDEATFDIIVDFIYQKTQFTPTVDNILRLFKAAYILKVEKLLHIFKWSAQYKLHELDSKGITDMLDFTVDKPCYRDLYLEYLCKHITDSWPNVAHMAEFYSVSWDTLEDWLLSESFYFDDPQKFLDMCSKWIMHDLQNRYELIPQVAFSIKKYAMPDFEDYKMETPSDLASCSEQSIRDRLSQIVCATSLIPADTLPNKEQRSFEEEPAFVTLTKCGIFDILNANFDRIATLSCQESCGEFIQYGYGYSMSAAIIGDNLFLWFALSYRGRFLAYNIPSKKFIALHRDSRITFDSTMLNCRNELYCCCKNGSILKYSLPLNRWMIFSKTESKGDGVKFTSDGEKIYRMYQIPGSQTDPNPRFVVEAYNFEQNTWTSLPELPSSIPGGKSNSAVDFTLIENCHLATLFRKVIMWFDDESQKWNEIRLREDQHWSKHDRNNSAVAHGENEIVQAFNNKLYHYSSSDQTWHLKKEMPIPELAYRNALYYIIISINRPIIRSSM